MTSIFITAIVFAAVQTASPAFAWTLQCGGFGPGCSMEDFDLLTSSKAAAGRASFIPLA